MLMLATVRIGAIHSVVFAGFGAQALGDRIVASGSRARLHRRRHLSQGQGRPPEGDRRRGARDAAAHAVEHVVVLRAGAGAGRADQPAATSRWDDFLAARRRTVERRTSAMEANEPAFILATSGTTAKPKLAVHTHGGYQVHIVSMGRWCFGLKPTDVWWATSDIGWIVGHSYMVYAPLLAGCTTVVVRGRARLSARRTRNWRAAVEEFGVTGIFTSPTAVRMLMRYGDDTARGRRSLAGSSASSAPAKC